MKQVGDKKEDVMAKVIDKEPKYDGEKKVWNDFSMNLPQNWVVYNTRSVNGREYDFCVMAPDMGLFIVEVKGWNPAGILTVVDENTIILAGAEEPEDSPRGQARGYRFDLLKKINRELGMNPLVMSLVCYPFISKDIYYEKGLNVVSEENETIFSDDLNDSSLLYQKFLGRYNIDKGAKHDELSAKRFALLRHHFEPNYDLKEEVEYLNPGYSRLRIIVETITEEKAQEIVDEYFSGIKEVVLVPNFDSLNTIVCLIDKQLEKRKIGIEKGNLSVEYKKLSVESGTDSFSFFNFEVEVIEKISTFVSMDQMVEEGECSDEQKIILSNLSKISAFNYQQFEIEHASSQDNILVEAGAGTGKTYSMVSRVAYLCNRTADAVVDIAGDIAMITFTNDAAENMKRRVKQMFMNYFVLTSNEKYMHYIEDLSQVQISTIHKFAISLLQRDCMRMGLGYDSQISSETYNRKQLYHYYLNEFLMKKSDDNPDFVRQLSMPTYKLEEMLISFCDKLYDRSIDVKKMTPKDFGTAVGSMPFFNEMISEVIINAELDYARDLKNNNLLGLRECMIQIHDLVCAGKLMKQGHNFKYVFVDEFQDTDDVQIETITELQKLFGAQCRLFIVGDLKQSIYRFRGASLSAFDKVTNVAGIGDWAFYSLNRNYRTDSRLLDLFNETFLQMGHLGVLPYREDKDRLTSRIKKEYSDDQLVRSIEVHGKDKDMLYQELFKEINYQIAELKKISAIKKLSSEEKTIAILVRYNYQIANIVKEAEKNADIEFTIKVTEGGDLYRLQSTIDLYRLVLAITHPTNNVYLANLIRSNYVALSANLAQIAGYTNENKTDELIHLLDEYFMLLLGKNWSQIVTDFESRPVLVALRDIYEAAKPWTHFMDEDSKISYRENYDCLIEKITQKFSKEYITINKVRDFLKINITTYQEAASRSSLESGDDIKVICTTIHKSKGLEYGTVIVPFNDDDISDIGRGGLTVNVVNGKVSYGLSFKGQGSDFSGGFDEKIETSEKICEETRVLYVAMTRAIRNYVWFKNLDSTVEKSWENYMEENT